jgi:hypothetical protein
VRLCLALRAVAVFVIPILNVSVNVIIIQIAGIVWGKCSMKQLIKIEGIRVSQ